MHDNPEQQRYKTIAVRVEERLHSQAAVHRKPERHHHHRRDPHRHRSPHHDRPRGP
ncbi:hypothetical protein G5V59_19950 [Nocardioides sp. W3-2-3]|uniref:hypothetical protein n=1 Tax=Nocardioides convexus TaxID=2712224 RepID=UPI0024181A23|nr:hypothetical protein [Nocardioides convexus]NHA01339.1 hypothetical protein [Nocardioides convexus]